MSLQINESWETDEGQDGPSPTDRLKFIVTGDPNPATDNADSGPVVQAFARANVPATYGGNVLQDVSRNRIAAGLWSIEASYAAPGQFTPTGEKTFTFSTGGGSQLVKHALNHVAAYKQDAGGDLDSGYNGWINPGKGSDVDGTTIDTAGFEFQIGLYLRTDQMTAGYVSLLYHLTDTVNAMEFSATVQGVPFSFDAGEVRFKGATGSQRGYGDFEITLTFAAQPNVEGRMIGDIPGVDARGWEYISIVTEETVKEDPTDTTNKFTAPNLRWVLVDQLYPEDNWTGLIPATGGGTTGLSGGGL